MRHVAILGSTGSIGQNTLSVIAQHPGHFRVIALAARRNVEQMYRDCQQFQPTYVAMADVTAARQLEQKVRQAQLNCEVLAGETSICDLAKLDEVDTVMAAIVGASGLPSTFAAASAGKRILLASKESLVIAGSLLLQEIKRNQACILPVDSEHNAIFQCLPERYQHNSMCLDLKAAGIHKIYLTGSGGALRHIPLTQLSQVTVEQALAHPNWSMGSKVTIDSATMMNKGLEYIEARWLFNAQPSQLEVVIHPQSMIHSMIQYQDGSILAQLGKSDMRIPIAHVLHYPERLDMPEFLVEDFPALTDLSFKAVDWERYPCLKLAIDSAMDPTACVVLNAANEIAVDAFLQRKIGFCEIVGLVETALSAFSGGRYDTLCDILQLDQHVRVWVEQRI